MSVCVRGEDGADPSLEVLSSDTTEEDSAIDPEEGSASADEAKADDASSSFGDEMDDAADTGGKLSSSCWDEEDVVDSEDELSSFSSDEEDAANTGVELSLSLRDEVDDEDMEDELSSSC